MHKNIINNYTGVFLDGKVQCQKLEEEKNRYKENLAFVSRCNPDLKFPLNVQY